MDTGPIRLERHAEGAIWRVILDAPKANVIDAAMTAALTRCFEAARYDVGLKAVVLEGAGRHFSFGASVEEHRGDQVADMLHGFHRMFRAILDARVTTLAAVRGQCLGGGLELAAFCHRVFAAPDATLGQPEIVLGVFAPVASVILAERVGRAAADDLLLSGRSIDAARGLEIGLVDALAEDPWHAAQAYVRDNLVARSASSLRYAVAAAAIDRRERFRRQIEVAERLYLDELMTTHDAVEGIEAFLAKRPAQWRHA